jgi:Calcineurin-like phosphoesterase
MFMCVFRNPSTFWFLSSVLVGASVLIPQPTKAAKAEAVYVVLHEDGPVARAVFEDRKDCPEISVDGASQPMSVRAVPDTGEKPAFPVLVCETRIPRDAKSAEVEGRALPLPATTLRRIAVFGDTGCRLKGPTGEVKETDDDDDVSTGKVKVQDCNKPKKWPFKQLSNSVAAAKPDLVIHVGDYYYRESPCPKGNKGCERSPHGDNWKTWKADFFAPAKSLLRAAPWIMTRGNHETCKRGGAGYMRFLDPRLAKDGQPPPCEDMSPTYTVTVAGRSFIVLDSSNAEDECGKEACNSAPYAVEFQAMRPASGAWLVSHKPIWGFKNKGVTLTDALQDALKQWNGKPPDGIALVISGHTHLWEALGFMDKRPPQFVLGNGGTKRAHKIEQPLTGQKIGGTTVAFAKSRHSFGFTIFAPVKDPAGWKATLHDPDGNEEVSCTIGDGEVNCD